MKSLSFRDSERLLVARVVQPKLGLSRSSRARSDERAGNYSDGETGLSGFAEQTIATIAVRISSDKAGHAARSSCNCGSVDDNKCPSVT